MTKIATTYNNFSRAKLDHDLDGRFDLSLYGTGADVFSNFISNFKGNAIYRAGLLLEQVFEDCAFVEFKFSKEQNYLCLFYELKVKFLTYDVNGNFGFVQNGGGDYELTSPYTLEQAKELKYDQNADVMKMVHPDVAPQDFERTSATTFTFTPSTTTGSLFDDPDVGTVGYPATTLFKDGRLYYGGTSLLPTKLWISEAGDYTQFTIPATILDDSPIQTTIADLTEPIEWLMSNERSVMIGNNKNPAILNGGDVNTPLTASNYSINVTGSEGSDNSQPLRKDGLVFYINNTSRAVYYFRYDILGESFKSDDSNFVSYDITKGNIKKLRYKKDRDDLIYTLREDGKLLSLNFNEAEKVVGWSIQETAGEIKDIAVISDNDGNPKLFCLVLRDDAYYIERLGDFIEFSRNEDFFTNDKAADSEAYNRKLSEELKQAIYLDNSDCFNDLKEIEITYLAGTITAASPVFASGDVGKFIVYKTKTGYEKGRFEITGFTSTTVVDVDVIIEPSQNTYDEWYLTFTELSGLDRFDGKEVSIVADGGYIGDFEVASGAITLNRAVTSVCVGIGYTGVIKTFPLGFAVQGENTQKNQKNIFQFGIRVVDSAGGLVGTSRYRLHEVQDLSQNDLNYLAPQLIDKTKLISYNDKSDVDKSMYIAQDKPLPFKITAVIIDTKYGVTR